MHRIARSTYSVPKSRVCLNFYLALIFLLSFPNHLHLCCCIDFVWLSWCLVLHHYWVPCMSTFLAFFNIVWILCGIGGYWVRIFFYFVLHSITTIIFLFMLCTPIIFFNRLWFSFLFLLFLVSLCVLIGDDSNKSSHYLLLVVVIASYKQPWYQPKTSHLVNYYKYTYVHIVTPASG